MLKKYGVFEGQNATDSNVLARSIGSVCPLHVKPKSRPRTLLGFFPSKIIHIRHIHFIPFVSIESCSDFHPIVSSSLQLPFSFFHQLLALLLGVVVAYASPT